MRDFCQKCGALLTQPCTLPACPHGLYRPRRNATAEEARMFDEALLASVEIIDPGIRQDQE